MALAGNDTSLPVKSKFTKLNKNVKFNLEYSERLVSKPFQVTMIQNMNVCTHLALVGHRNSLWNTWKSQLIIKIHGKNNYNANTVPMNAVEAT